ncbi:MAG: TonB-dependent receptor family protein [Luteimonas sp.]
MHRHAAVFLLCCASMVQAAPPEALPGVIVTGKRVVAGTPASLDRVDAADVPARAQASVSELLRRVPGVAARDRQNLAQDVQFTIRGFGARSAFGVRGLQIFQDGIPATMPDGQGQLSHIPLEALDHVDVLRGPFSALYGNASGGVVEFSSADPPSKVEFGMHGVSGSDSMGQGNLWLAGPWHEDGDAGEGYRIDIGHLDLAGFRRHSRARRDTRQARLLAGTDSGTHFALTVDSLDLAADDPQGLTFAEALATPRAASAGALAFDTRKTVSQQQLGLHVAQPLGAANTLSLNTWGGTRDTFQMLSIPVAAQQAPGSGGGVVDLDRRYAGTDLRWRLDGSLAKRAASLTVGMQTQRSSEHRRGYENFVGDSLGVVGALRRDQQDTVRNRDLYAEGRWEFAPRWSATLGARRSHVDFESHDAYVTPGNPDDSGTLHYAQTTPVAGLSWQTRDWLEFYANAGRGFETPSFAELGYRSDGTSGLNDALRPARSRSVEVGMRAHRGGHAFEMVAFDSRTSDELVVASNIGGRSTYTNATGTRRSGWELSTSGPLAARWQYALAYSRLDARYRDAFVTCRAPPCDIPDTLVAAGNRIPATAPDSLWAELRWTPASGTEFFAQADAVGRAYADDANTAHAPGYATLDVGMERHWSLGRLTLDGFARVDNLLDRHAIGSVIVNEGNGRYFEPAPGRGWSVGLSLHSATP